jgi:pyruvate-formate lyase
MINFSKKLRISFDFDGTLDDEFDGVINNKKEEIQKIARKYIEEGHQVCIITKRYGPEMSNMGLVNEHSVVLSLAKYLNIKEVYFTNREMKFSHILNLKIDIHFENSEYEVELINQVCKENKHNCLVVHVEDPLWRDLVY